MTLEQIAGGIILAVLGADVFATVLHPSSGAGPYTSAQNRVVWWLTRALARLLPWRSGTLSFAAPLMAVATPAAWVAWLTLGFALVYHPVVPTFGQNPPATVGSWIAALYYSGYVTSTLGLGDITPVAAGWRMATVVHAALGFALFSAAITYILSIYRRHADDAALAAHIHDLTGDGGPTTGSAQDADLCTLARELAGVNVAHRQYPILHYFHGPAETSLPVQIGRLIDFVEQVESGSGCGAALRGAIDGYLEQMPFSSAEGDEPGVAGLRRRHHDLLVAHLREHP